MLVGGEYPKLRPVEARPSRYRRDSTDLIDPSGIAESTLTISGRTLFILSRLNGRVHRANIQAEYMVRHGRMLYSDELDDLLDQLDEALFLDGPRFERHMAELSDKYRKSPFREMRDADGFGVEASRLGAFLDRVLASARVASSVTEHGRLVGIVAPHLDYPRGSSCYAAAYRELAKRTDATRFVILGTNHFGRSLSVVGTSKDFETPFGLVRNDPHFMEQVSRRCGYDICEKEHDHLREHSVELQVVMLRHALGDRPFTIAPFLCPDVCGPTGTTPPGGGVDLQDFSIAISDLVKEDGVPTCIIAGADLSHVGRYFQDDRDLDQPGLELVEDYDRSALAHLVAGSPDEFRKSIAGQSNKTNICSVGCLYAIGVAMGGRATPKLLEYHQAMTKEIENCVTCAALEWVK